MEFNRLKKKKNIIKTVSSISLTDLPIVSIIIFFVLLLTYAIRTNNFFSMFQIQDILLNSMLAITLAALGEGIVILSGGFDLSAGATLVLVNVTIVTAHTSLQGNLFLWAIICIAIGLVVGVVNGFLVAVLRLPAIIATLAVMFILYGITLLVMPRPAGTISMGYINALTGTIGKWIPISLFFFLLLAAFIIILKKTSFGLNIYAVGSNEYTAYLNGVKTKKIKFLVYVIAGIFYALSGLYITAQMGSGDPTLGSSFTLAIFAAVVIGGIRIGGGQGSLFGSFLGSGIMNLTTITLFVIGVSSYWGPIMNGVILIGAVVLSKIWKN